MNKTCLSYWFPILEAAGLPVPKTIILHMGENAARQVYGFLSGEPENGSAAAEEFAGQIGDAARKLGFPAFLRTGQTSYKHNWRKACFLADEKSALTHICAIAEFSECCDMLGLPWDVWVVREMLPTKPITVLPQYGGFPLVREVRCFISSGKVVCWHPYWPTNAIEEGMSPAVDQDELNQFDADVGEHARLAQTFDESEFMPLAQRCADAFKDDDAFSVDLLPTERGWYVTDMALAARSWHWPDCPMEAEMRKPSKKTHEIS